MLRTLVLIAVFFIHNQVYSQHNIIIQYWQDATVIDTSAKVHENCSCLMTFIQTIDRDYDAYSLPDTAYAHIVQYVHSSPWVFKEAHCKEGWGRLTILQPNEVNYIFLR